MLQQTDPHMDNLMFLRDVVVPHCQSLPSPDYGKHPEEQTEDSLSFGNWGTTNHLGAFQGCLLGWYCKLRHGSPQPAFGLMGSNGSCFTAHEFGWGLPARTFFGNDGPTLDERLKLVENEIARIVNV